MNTSHLEERRQRRSNHRGEALHLLLASRRAQGDLRGLVVSDGQGLLVADSVGPDVDATRLAAEAVAAKPERSERHIAVVPVDALGETFHLAFVGRPPSERDWLEGLVAGTRRILHELS